jgi:hypothetical protein
MANLTPSSSFDNVYQFETTDIIQGGPGGVDNQPHQQLLNRTEWLNNNKLKNTTDTFSGLLMIIRAAATALAIRSNATNSVAQMTIGRTSDDFILGVAGGSSSFFNGTVAGDAAIYSPGKIFLGGSGANTAQLVLSSPGVGIFGSPTYALDIAQRAATDNVMAVRSPAGRFAMLSLAGNNATPQSNSFDIFQSGSGEGVLRQNGGALLRFQTNNADAATVDTSQRFSFNNVHSVPSGGSNLLGGLIGVSNFSDYFTADADKRIHHYGLQWLSFSWDTAGPSASLSGYGGLNFWTHGALAGSVNAAQRWTLSLDQSIYSGRLTVKGTTGISIAHFDGPDGYAYCAWSRNSNGAALGYVGQSGALISGGSNSAFTVRAESQLDFALGGTQYGYLNSGGWTFHNNGVASSTIARVLSGASASFAGFQVGRVNGEGTLGVAALPGQFFTGTSAADVALRAEGGSLWLGAINTASVSVSTNNANRLSVDGSGGIWVRPDASGGFDTNLADLKTRSLSTNGYQKLPGGLIVQWGHQNGDGAVTFPIAFPNACFTVIPGSRGSGSGTGGEGTPRAVAGTVTRFGFTGSSSTWAGLPYDWVAFGN